VHRSYFLSCIDFIALCFLDVLLRLYLHDVVVRFVFSLVLNIINLSFIVEVDHKFLLYTLLVNMHLRDVFELLSTYVNDIQMKGPP
jgi:hypothetical protein